MDIDILLTNGGAEVDIDRVRRLKNMSHGTFGSKIARELLQLMDAKDRLTFLTAKVSHSTFSREINWYGLGESEADDELMELLELRKMERLHRHHYDEFRYRTFREYHMAVESRLKRMATMTKRTGSMGIVVLAAAISDYLVKNYIDGKVRSTQQLSIELEPSPKIIGLIKEQCPECRLVGFKLLVDSTDEDLICAARNSAVDNGCDFVVANDLRDIVQGEHRVLLVNKDGLVATHHTDPDDPNYLARIVANRVLCMQRIKS